MNATKREDWSNEITYLAYEWLRDRAICRTIETARECIEDHGKNAMFGSDAAAICELSNWITEELIDAVKSRSFGYRMASLDNVDNDEIATRIINELMQRDDAAVLS